MAGGCRKTAYVAGIGCLGVIILGSVFVAGGMWYARRTYSQLGERKPGDTTITIPSGGSTGGAGSAAGAQAPGGGGTSGASGPDGSRGSGTASGPAPVSPPGRDLPDLSQAFLKPTNLHLLLEEGEFIVQPGPPGSDIVVEGHFDSRDYELTQKTDDTSDGRDVTVRFRPKRGWLVRMLAGHFDTHDGNRVIVTIPEGLPTALDLRLAKCGSRVELGGLTLTDLKAQMAMGEQRLNFAKPLAARLPRAEFRTSMGEVHVSGVGNAAPESFSLTGSMGEHHVDFDGAWPRGAQSKATIRLSMGEIRVRVPGDVRITASSRTSSSLGDSRVVGEYQDKANDPNAPTLDLKLHASMGDATLIHE
jgi:hypothetical protein